MKLTQVAVCFTCLVGGSDLGRQERSCGGGQNPSPMHSWAGGENRWFPWMLLSWRGGEFLPFVFTGILQWMPDFLYPKNLLSEREKTLFYSLCSQEKKKVDFSSAELTFLWATLFRRCLNRGQDFEKAKSLRMWSWSLLWVRITADSAPQELIAGSFVSFAKTWFKECPCVSQCLQSQVSSINSRSRM